MSRRFFFTAALTALVAAVIIPSASAARPIHESVTFEDITFPDAYLSDACGTTVVDTFSGTFTATLFPASSGASAHEVDTIRGSITYSAPDTGNSVSRTVNGASQAVYPEGIAVGAPAVVTIDGENTATITGLAPPGSGRIVANATIVFIDDLGVPITVFETSDIVSVAGNYAGATAAICAALT
jgi:hypothetical protein